MGQGRCVYYEGVGCTLMKKSCPRDGTGNKYRNTLSIPFHIDWALVHFCVTRHLLCCCSCSYEHRRTRCPKRHSCPSSSCNAEKTLSFFFTDRRCLLPKLTEIGPLYDAWLHHRAVGGAVQVALDVPPSTFLRITTGAYLAGT